MTKNRPDWVMFGFVHGETHVVIASTNVTQGEIQETYETYESEIIGMISRERELKKVTLSVDMKSYIVVTGSTYQEAMTRLFREWSPTDPNRAQIGSERGISDGRGTS